jgi:hypothetical protein
MAPVNRYVRFTPESGHSVRRIGEVNAAARQISVSK